MIIVKKKLDRNNMQLHKMEKSAVEAGQHFHGVDYNLPEMEPNLDIKKVISHFHAKIME